MCPKIAYTGRLGFLGGVVGIILYLGLWIASILDRNKLIMLSLYK